MFLWELLLLFEAEKVKKNVMRDEFRLQATIHEQVSNYLHPCRFYMPIICWTESTLAKEVNHA